MKQQHLVYFVSEVLARSKKYYSEIEKICYANIMSSRNSSDRIRKWATELSEYIIDFERRSAIKSQITWQNGQGPRFK
jgi:hypothetical protein